jgi:hypothetical protein
VHARGIAARFRYHGLKRRWVSGKISAPTLLQAFLTQDVELAFLAVRVYDVQG